MNDITIVTAFYDIGRGNLNKCKRTHEQYLEYFDFWANLQNNLIIYTTEDFKEKIFNIRKKYNLENKTTIIVKDLFNFESKAYQDIKKVFKQYNQTLHRKNPDNIECNSDLYCYLMYLKPFFVCDSIEKKLTSDKIMWLDFGFNHGKDFFLDKSQFNFLLKEQLYIDNNKMNFFSIKDDENISIANIYFSMDVFLIGSLFYGNKNSWYRFKEDFSKCLNIFLSFNIMDDDQIMLLWCTRNYPDYYNIIKINEWFGCLFYFIPKNIQKNITFKRQTSQYYKLIKKEIRNSNNKNLIYKIKLYFKYIYYKFINKKTLDF